MAVSVSAEEEKVIKQRLLTQTTVARVNADPPLKRLTKRFVALCASAAQGPSAETSSLHAQFLRELELFESQARQLHLGFVKAKALSRAATVSGANERERENYNDMLAHVETLISQSLGEIECLKVELDAARTERKHKEEYEVLRRHCVSHPSRAATLADIVALKQDISALEQESAATAATVELRKQQFMTLLRGVDELGRALEEDGPAPASTASAAPMQVD